ncbi:chaperone for outer membrane proteins, Skp family [Formosa sp. Hel1_31_208]|uniref:OmpH family outer membrane protein n=1 Tax=Formosa sp. Hel1_31_208 TaxID=1798225 RepID=UPI000879A238|nr:OmpH family outer membrane protein [Formosa sp. Hel1_31_208]SDR67062.1 chaperone for outer membrane proteins, Skp family [Formosa sp. Hel1_31_208]
MKSKVLFLVTILSLMSFVSNAQRGVRIGYIDTEYILQNIPEYQEANTQLDQKVQQWKTEIEKRLSVIDSKKKQLNSESVLLTKELYEERMEDISFEEAEILDYQQKRFGPNGDLMIQKQQLIQPIQDQIFAAVQEIADGKKYDFIFDKSADVVMLYSAERFDISELVIRSISRSSKRTQAKSRAERKQAEKEDVVPIVNKELDERQKAIEDKKAARDAQIAERQSAQLKRRDSLKAAAAERRQKILDDRAKAKEKRDSTNARKTTPAVEKNMKKTDSTATQAKTTNTATKTPKQIAEEKRQQKIKDREARKKELDERKKKILEARKKAKEERESQKKETDSVPDDN